MENKEAAPYLHACLYLKKWQQEDPAIQPMMDAIEIILEENYILKEDQKILQKKITELENRDIVEQNLYYELFG